jgi:hypothetical protein
MRFRSNMISHDNTPVFIKDIIKIYSSFIIKIINIEISLIFNKKFIQTQTS